MKFNVIFNKEPLKNKIDFFSTNILKIDPHALPIVDSSKILTYSLNDHYLTGKFTEAFLKTQALNLYQDDYAIYNYNYYMNPDSERVVLAKTHMNETIDELNNINLFQIDTALKLDPSQPEIAEFDKINELHFRFESELINLPKDLLGGARVWYLLEKVNNLVHFIERVNEYGGYTPSYFMMSMRAKCRPSHWYKLQPEDYFSFDYFKAGDLVADFSTVGKDLWAASTTNDLELVHRKECKQQEFITEYAFIPFNNDQRTFDLPHGFWDWCKKNDVGNYLDLNDPKYRPGRHTLGKLENVSLPDADAFYDEIFNTTPYCEGVYMTDDQGNIIL